MAAAKKKTGTETEGLKNLATCKPSEFLSQTNKIRKAVKNWLTLTDIMNIRKRMPELTDDMSDEEKEALVKKQTNENFNAILDSVLEEHADETLEVLALASFVDPKDVDNHTVKEYIRSFTELINDEDIISFFTSLIGLEQKLG